MTPDLIVREAVESDIAAVTRIYAHYVLNSTANFEVDAPDEKEMLRRLRTIVDRGYPYLVAAVGNEVYGYAYAGAYRPRPAYRYTVEDSIYIDPLHLGQGIGQVLLGRLIENCVARRHRQMIAVIGDAGNIGSIALHRKFGFRMVGTLEDVGFKLGEWVDTVLMQKSLSAD